MNWREQALSRLETGFAAGSYSRYGEAMKEGVRAALEDFCRQDEEFAQAVAQGGSFESCMKVVAKGCSTSLSDLEAYRRAVQFYFPGAEIRFQMAIDLCGEAEEHPGTVLNLADFW